jgi:manganese transport protein
MIYGDNIDDHETSVDEKLLEEYKEFFQKRVWVEIQLGFGNQIGHTEIINKEIRRLVMGTGHTGSKIYFWNYR